MAGNGDILKSEVRQRCMEYDECQAVCETIGATDAQQQEAALAQQAEQKSSCMSQCGDSESKGPSPMLCMVKYCMDNSNDYTDFRADPINFCKEYSKTSEDEDAAIDGATFKTCLSGMSVKHMCENAGVQTSGGSIFDALSNNNDE